MLAALERGLKGNKWFSLIDKVWSERTLGLAWEKVQVQRRGLRRGRHHDRSALPKTAKVGCSP